MSRYIGARYVPLILGEWDNTKSYEPLSVVVYQGNSYTSKKNVPVGVDITNTAYWVQTGNYNQQIEQMYNEWEEFHDEVNTTLREYAVTPEMFGAVGDGVADDTTAVRTALSYPCVLFNNTYAINSAITTSSKYIFGRGKIKSTNGFIVCTNDIHIDGITIIQEIDETSIAITCNKSAFINNVKIENGLGGILVNGSYNETVIRNCILKNFYGDTCFAIDVNFAGITLIEGNTIEGVSNNLTRDADGIKVWQNQDSSSYPCVVIANNTIHNCRGRFIKSSTANCEIKNNYCYNDDNYETIGAFLAIDVQKGNSIITGNIIKNVKNGINVSFRFYETNHYIADNLFDGLNAVADTGAIQFNSYDDTINCYVVMERNTTLNYNNRAYTLAYGLHTYIMRDCIHHGYSSNTSVGLRGTANQTTRFEFYNCKCDYNFFAIFFNIIPNAYAEGCEVRCTVDQTFATTLPDTKYYATFTEGVTGSVGFSTIHIFGSSRLIALYDNNNYKIFNGNGQEL